MIKEGGGHKAAAGVSLTLEQLPGFRNFLSQIPPPEEHILNIDAEVTIAALLNTNLDLLEPFGQANPCPRFLLRNVSVESYRLFKDMHAKITLTDNITQFVVMYFNANNNFLVKNKKLDAVVKYTSGRYTILDIRDAQSANFS